MRKSIVLMLFFVVISFKSYSQYVMPEENVEHEGTWLQWPHHYTYGMWYRNSLDDTWVDMTAALVESENVHIIAYNTTQRDRIIDLLNEASVPLTNIDFYIHQNDDVWIRDNGPIFVYDTNDDLVILDWGFNGWGEDAPYSLCNLIPSLIANDLEMTAVDLSAMVLEGGAIEHDGRGTMMATRSSVTHSSRNPELTEEEIEIYLSDNMGFTNFIWLDGVYGTEDITDMHIDGFAKFANDSTILTLSNEDLLYWEVSQDDINTLMDAKNIDGEPYNFIILPLTQNDVTTAYGNQLDYKGSYCNYYIANTVVLVPNYNDPNDNIANAIIQVAHPDKTVIGIDVRNLYENGGMIHCVTQQQPVNPNQTKIKTSESNHEINIYPNPGSDKVNISSLYKLESVEIRNNIGQVVYSKNINKQEFEIDLNDYSKGTYFISIYANSVTKIFKIVKA